MTSKLTREENVQAVFDLKAGYTLGLADVEILKRVARMALAAMNSEPVAENIRIADALDGLLWPDMALGNKAVIQAAIEALRTYHAQPAPERERLAIENFRSAMEGIGHIRRTLEETFCGLHGTHVEPDVLMDCKTICDAIYAAYSGNSPVIPDGYVMVPMRLTAENGAKGALSSEFSETKFVNCPECFGDDECETCDGSGRIEITVPVTWTTIKEIWAKGVEHFAAAPQEVKK